MKKTLGAAFVLVTAFTMNARAQSAQASANTDAKVLTAISLSNSAELQFGSFIASGSSGTVVLGTDDGRTQTGGVTLTTQGTTPTAAAFTASGESGYTYSLTLPSTVTLTRSGGTETMTLGTLTHDETGTLTGGSETFHVGGTLTVAADQTSGNYSGSFDATVTYN